MTDPVEPPTPLDLNDIVVNDRYWLGRGRTFLDEALEKRLESAKQLVTAVGWFWSVYAAAAIVGLAALEDVDSAWVAVALAIPALLMIGAYWHATKATLPVDIDFDSVDPQSVRLAYETSLSNRKDSLKSAYQWAAVAALSVIVGIVATAITATHGHSDTELLGSSVKTEDDGQSIAVLARLPADQSATINVTNPDGKPVAPAELTKADSNGKILVAFDIPKSRVAEEYRVTMRWTPEDKSVRTVAIVVKP